MDDTREDECETRTALYLIVDFAGTDTASLLAIDSPCQRVELFNFQQPSANPGTELRSRHVPKNELRLKRADEFPTGSASAVSGGNER